MNKETVPNKFRILAIDELLNKLWAAVVFTKMDLKFDYYQIRMRRENILKMTFRTHEGHYEFLVILFGLINALVTFQFLMNQFF